MDVINDFRGAYRWLSNFHMCEVHHENMVYPSTEHAYQAAKTNDLAARLPFCGHDLSCGEARRAGQRLVVRRDWNCHRLTVMYSVVVDKFTRHEDLKRMLVATGSAQLVEGNTWGDQFWGVCDGKGYNSLGLILMMVRDHLCTQEAR
jgi:ribA/ribD-fused uncharacterized protein